MNPNLAKIVFPWTILCFILVQKWWYVLPVDARDTLFWGFPLAFIGEGWHTSMSFQIFFLEGVVDLCIQFLFWFLLVFLISRYLNFSNLKKVYLRLLWSVTFIAGSVMILYIGFSDPVYHLKRPYDWHMMTSGYQFIWQKTPRPEIEKFHPEKQKPDSTRNFPVNH